MREVLWIHRAMAAASAAEETIYDLSKPESFLGFLEDAGIRLVRLEYLIELSASGRPLPRRQEAEKETTSSGAPALVESSELKEVSIDPSTAHMSVMLRQPVPRRVQVHLVSISHMWGEHAASGSVEVRDSCGTVL